MDPALVGVTLAIAGAIALALVSIFVRKGTDEEGTAEEALGVTLALSFLAYFIFSFIRYFPNFGITNKSMIIFVGHGVFSYFIANLTKFHGIKKIGSARTSPIVRMQVFFSSIIAVLFLGESLTSLHLLGLVILTVGVILVSRETAVSESKSLGSDGPVSIYLLFPLLAAFFYGLAKSIIRLGLMEGTPISVGLTLSVTSAEVSFIVYSIAIRSGSPFAGFKSRNRIWYILAGLANIAAYTFIYTALRLARVVVAVPFLNITPLFVLAISFFFLPRLERVTSKLAVGSIFVVVGAFFITVFM